MAQRVRSIDGGMGDDQLRLHTSESGQHVIAETQQLIFQTSTFAMLKAKGYELSPEEEKKAQAILGANMDSLPTSYLDGAKQILDYMKDLWVKEKLCDVVIQTETGELKAHKIAMGAYSDALTMKFQEFPDGELVSIDLRDFKHELVYALLRFMYTTEITISEENVATLMVCASDLGITIVTKMCQNFLNTYGPKTALPYHAIAEDHHMEDLRSNIYGFILEKFPEISLTPEFTRIPYEKIIALLQDDGICAFEMDVFLAVVRWVDTDRCARLKLAPMLLQCVRFQTIAPEELATKCETVEWIFKPPECLALLNDAYKYHALYLSGSDLAANFPVQRGRNPSGVPTDPPESLPGPGGIGGEPMIQYDEEGNPVEPEEDPYASVVMIGGVDLQSLDPDVPGRCVFSLHQNGQWEELASLAEYTHHHASASLNNMLYVIGGAVYDYRRPDVLGGATNRVLTYNHTAEIWTLGPPMNESRAYFGVCVYNGCIYAVGGEDASRQNLDTIEKFDGTAWTYENKMPSGGKIGASVACLNGCIYICGGYKRAKPTNQMVDTVECYSIEHQAWIDKNPLQMPRCHSSLCVSGGFMYLIGGRSQTENSSSGVTSLSTVHIYNEAGDVWEPVAEMSVARHDAGCCAIGGKIYIVGGMQTPSPYCLDSVEIFNTATGAWETDVPAMPFPAAGISCARLSMQ